jgi:heme-degrading monooxygenase HmoA
METLYTHTTWRVKPGREDDFVRSWEEWVDWSHLQGLHEEALLLRDVESPQTFVSFGRWESIDVARGWRAAPGYKERLARLQEALDGFEPRTLEVVEER